MISFDVSCRTPYDIPPNPYDDPSWPSGLHPTPQISLRTSGTGQYSSPNQSPLRTSGTGQFPSPGSSPTPPAPTTSPLRTSSTGQSPNKHEGASGGLAVSLVERESVCF
jgi:hypothetical protein